MKKIIIMILSALLAMILFMIIAPTGYSEQKSGAMMQTIINACRPDVPCGGNCLDGFGEYCYFDATQFNKEELAQKAGFSLSEELRANCFGIFSSSVCGKCFEKFELKTTDGFKEVSCEQFLQVIEEKNKACDGCLDEILAGCC